MREHISREAAWAALRRYNQEPFHLQHALTVEGVMQWYAKELGYGDDAEFWGIVGLLHDIDFERWPEEHCQKAPELLREAGCGEDCDFRMRSLGGGRRGYAESIGDKQGRAEGAGKVNGGAAYPADDVEHKAHSVAPVADYRSLPIHFALAHAHTSPRTNETVPSCIALSSNTDTFTADAASSLHIAETYTPRSVGSV